jgi:transcriptional/translational regulatory protein YebC/TACO1
MSSAQYSQKKSFLLPKVFSLFDFENIHLLTVTVGGGDVNSNPRLATIIATAKKGIDRYHHLLVMNLGLTKVAGFPKASIEAAIARGQGRSTSGAALESITLEVMMPPKIGVIIEASSDNRNRTTQELRTIVKYHQGTVSPTTYLFQKKGRLSFEKDERNLGVDDVLEEAIEAGAEDVEVDEEGSLVIWTEPNKTTSTTEALAKSLSLKVEDSDIIWDANLDTKARLDSDPVAESLIEFLEAIRENPATQEVYANVEQGTVSDTVWENLTSKLD